jgi:hypothetical protein
MDAHDWEALILGPCPLTPSAPAYTTRGPAVLPNGRAQRDEAWRLLRAVYGAEAARADPGEPGKTLAAYLGWVCAAQRPLYAHRIAPRALQRTLFPQAGTREQLERLYGEAHDDATPHRMFVILCVLSNEGLANGSALAWRQNLLRTRASSDESAQEKLRREHAKAVAKLKRERDDAIAQHDAQLRAVRAQLQERKAEIERLRKALRRAQASALATVPEPIELSAAPSPERVDQVVARMRAVLPVAQDGSPDVRRVIEVVIGLLRLPNEVFVQWHKGRLSIDVHELGASDLHAFWELHKWLHTSPDGSRTRTLPPAIEERLGLPLAHANARSVPAGALADRRALPYVWHLVHSSAEGSKYPFDERVA